MVMWWNKALAGMSMRLATSARSPTSWAPGRLGFLVAQAGAGHGESEHLDHLRAERPGEGPVAADGGLAGDPTLLVSGGAQRQIGGLLEEAMPGLHAVPGGQDTPGRLVRMCRSTRSAPRTPVWTPAAAARSVSGRTPTTTRTRSAVAAKSGSPATLSRPASEWMALTVTSLTTWTSWRPNSSPSSRPSSISTVG